MSFFDDIGEALSPLAPVVELGGALYNLFGNDKNQSAEAMRSVLGASINPKDPRFRNLAALFEEKAREDAIRGVNEAERARRAAIARGDMPVLSERRDEARYKTLSRAFQDAGRYGNQQAMAALTGAAPQYGPLVNYDQQANQTKKDVTTSGIAGLADLLYSYQPEEKQKLLQTEF